MIRIRTTTEGRRYDVRLRDPVGRVYTRTFRTRKEAERYEAKERTDRARGAWIDPRRGTVTVREWSERWMARPDLRPRTHQLYEGLLQRQILPSLGDVELAGLSPSAVRAWYAGLMGEAGPGASTGAKAYRLLRAMLATAVSDEVIARNPCQLKGAGVERAPERPLATIAQVEALTEAIVPRLRALVLLAAWCGLRRGELLGLRRQDLDLLHEAVRIERAMNQFEDGRILLGPPKSDAGRRVVAIPPHILPAIEDHLLNYVGSGAEALVFTGTKGGPLRYAMLDKAWRQARVVTGLTDLHLHDLRHAGNTWAATRGASTKELMARMGHASAAAALRYQHATADRDRAVAHALSGLARPAGIASITDARRAGTGGRGN